MSKPLRVVVFKDAGMFVAQCLEIDIAAQGSTEAEAAMRLNAVFKAEVAEAKQKGIDIEEIGPAPAEFHAAYSIDVVSRTELFAA
jgi:hypothetical protein